MLEEKGINFIPVDLRAAEEDIHDYGTHIDSDGYAEVDDSGHDGCFIVSSYCQHYCPDGSDEETRNCSPNSILGDHVCGEVIDHGVHDHFIYIAADSYYERTSQ